MAGLAIVGHTAQPCQGAVNGHHTECLNNAQVLSLAKLAISNPYEEKGEQDEGSS